MKCPLLQLGWTANPQTIKTEITDCLKEECAWWSPHNEACVVFGYYWLLHDIAQAVEALKEKGR